MGEWIRKFFSDSVSQSGIKKGEDASEDKLPAVRSSASAFRRGARSTGKDELEDVIDVGTAVSELLSSLIDTKDLGSLSRVLEEKLPRIVPFDIGTLRWSRPDPAPEDPSFEMEDDFPESMDLIAAGSILAGSRDVRMQGPVQCEVGGIWSGHMDGVCRARTSTGEPLVVRMLSGLVMPLFHDEDEIGVLLLFSTREGVLDKLGNEPSLRMIWKGIGSTVGRMVEAVELQEDLQRTKELLNSSNELLILWREVDQLWEIDCNSNAERFFLRDSMMPEMMEGPFFAPPGKEFERAMDAWKKVLDTGETSIIELELLSIDGERDHYLCLFSPYDPDGETVGVRMTGIRSGLVASALPNLFNMHSEGSIEEVDIVSMVECAVREHREANGSDDVVFENGSGACGIRVHPVMKHAVSALLSHSARSTAHGRKISIGMSADVRGVTISISNGGRPVVPYGDQGSPMRDRGPNNSLLTAYGIVELHGGSILSDNGNEDGTSYIISLPWSRN